MLHQLSWWEKSVLLKPFDFAILGAGLIGKQIALKIQLKYPSARVAIVDRSPISYGASTRNAGFACFGSVTEIVDDMKKSDVSAVIELLGKRYSGIQMLVHDFGADVIGYKNTGSCEVFTNSEDFDLALSSYSEINTLVKQAHGLENVFQLKPSKHFQMNVHETCLYNSFEGMLNSGLLNHTISERIHKAGVIPLYGCKINNYSKGQDLYTMVTDNGMEIHCKQLILANNAFAKDFLPNEDIEPARGQIVLTKPINNLPFDSIFHSDKGYMYFRNVDDRVLIGGARNHFHSAENTFNMQGSDEVKEYLIQYLKTVVLPNKEFEIDMHWSGIMAMGKEKLPMVKRIDNNLIVCVRMGGMGVALGPVLSDEVLEMI